MGHALALPLLDFLAYKAGCAYLSDLPRATGWQRARLMRALENIPADSQPPRLERRAGLSDTGLSCVYLAGGQSAADGRIEQPRQYGVILKG